MIIKTFLSDFFARELTVLNKTAKTFIIIFAAALVLCIVSSGLLIYSYSFEYDADIQHFNPSVPVYCTYAALALGAVAAAVGYFTAGKRAAIDTANEKTSFVETFFAVLSALLCILCALLIMRKGMPEKKAYLVCIKIALYFASAVYFAIKSFAEKLKKNPAFGLLGLIPSFLFIISIICCYFDDYHALNSAYLILELLMLVSFMLAFAFECGLEVHKPFSARKYLFGAALAVACAGPVAISKLAVELISGVGFTYELLDGVFFTVLWLYVTVRLARRTVIAFEKEPEPEEQEADESIEADSDKVAGKSNSWGFEKSSPESDEIGKEDEDEFYDPSKDNDEF